MSIKGLIKTKQKGSSVLFAIVYLAIITGSIILFTRTISINSARLRATSFNESTLVGSSLSLLTLYRDEIKNCLDEGYFEYVNDTSYNLSQIANMSVLEKEKKCFEPRMIELSGINSKFDELLNNKIQESIDIFNEQNAIDFEIVLNEIKDYNVNAIYDPTRETHVLSITNQTFIFDYKLKQLIAVPYDFEDIDSSSTSTFDISITFSTT